MRIFLILILYSFIITSYAQELPPIQVYTPSEYSGENQNWAITQGENQSIYIANNKGLLEFNGAEWQLYNSPNETIMRSVLAVEDRVYSGCYMEFGYWIKDKFGVMQYTSISKKVQEPLIEDEQFWNILRLEEFILFQSLNRIYIYNVEEETFKIINSKTNIIKIFLVNDEIYFQRINDGLYKLQSGKEVLVSGNSILRDNVIVNVYSNNKSLLVLTQDNGFFVLENNEIENWSFNINDTIKNFSIYNSISLSDGSIALGTISNGLVLLSKDKELKYNIDQENGLSNNTVLSLFEDNSKNIWLGLDNGVNCLNTKSAFKVYNDYKGVLGSVYTSILHKGNLYLGTNQGLFYKKMNSNESFAFVEGTQGQVWALRQIDGTLFCGHNFGTFIIEEERANKISDIQGTWDIKMIPEKENLLLQGNYSGLNVLEKTGNNWRYRNKVDGFNISSQFFEFINSSELLVAHEYKGVYNIKLSDAYNKVNTIDIDTLSKGLNSSLVKMNDNILYAFKDGIYKYQIGTRKFIKDSILSTTYSNSEYSSGKLISDQEKGRAWFFNNSSIGYIESGKLSNTPKIENISLPKELRNTLSGNENILHLGDEVHLLGKANGYITIDLGKLESKDYQINLNYVLSKKNKDDLEFTQIDQSIETTLSNNDNNIEFSFSIAEFEKYFIAEYQYQLEGIYDYWSHWSTKSKEVFENLPYGDYTFRVRGRIDNNITTNTAVYSFTIDRPWYLTNVMIAVYVLSILLFSIMMHNIYKRYYAKQREKLIEKNRKDLELKELENKQQIMSFNNERLKQDIESKNRELAISTMSLIKKNEFLSTVKGELNNINDGSSVKPVLRLIDKNLNSTDDWKLFEEAFNNADKNFLKKVKAVHPALTPNDLKLCAYLRLNLSSKEIAPLLNISPRSVEVKRYRLRKKMNLSHESSLTNYILEI